MSKRRREAEGIEKSGKVSERGDTAIDEKRAKGPTDAGDLKVRRMNDI
jgi:hypothetical protein